MHAVTSRLALRRLLPARFASGTAAFALAAAACLAAVAPGARAAGDEYPSRPISLVVPFAAGGSLDVTARVLAPKMSDSLGQQIIILNKPGAGSSLGARAVAGAKPDGYTLFLASGSAYAFMHLLLPGYNLRLKDFAPIAGIATNTSLFAVNSRLPVKSLAELVDYAEKNPGKLSFCTTGVGGLNHLQLEMFKAEVKEQHAGQGINVTHVPYNGLAPALTALRANDVQACTLPFSSIVKNFDGKGIRIIAVMRPQRLPMLPQVATTGEQGFPALDGNEALVNVAAPAGTPPAVLTRLEEALQKAMQDPEVRGKLEELDVQPTFVGSAATKEWLEQDVRKFENIIRNAGLAVNQ